MTLKQLNTRFPLQSGMCVELELKNKNTMRIILFKTKKNKLCYLNFDSKYSWDFLETIYNYRCNIIKVYQSPTVNQIFNKNDLIYTATDNDIVEVPVSEIAKKFGVKPENMRIIS